MTEPVLVVDDDPFVLSMLAHAGRARGLEVVGVRTRAEALERLAAGRFGVAVVDLRLGTESGLDVIRHVRAYDPSTESIVISSDNRLSIALESYAHDVFAFVPKPFDPAQLFATVDRALERRRGALERQRLTWELSLLNEVAGIVASSLEIEVVMQRAAERIATAFQAEFVVIRLRPSDRGEPRVMAAVGHDRLELERAYAQPGVWPSDRTLMRGEIVRIGDVGEGEPQAFTQSELYARHLWRSTLSVPIAVSDEVLGAIIVSSMTAHRFVAADEQFLQTVGRQFAVAVTNAQLYERVHRAKVEWERTFDAISDPIAVFDARGRTMRVNAALARLREWRITETQGRTCAEVGLCGGGCPACVVGQSSRENRAFEREVSTADGRIFAVTTLPVTGRSGTVVQFGKEVTEERRRAAQLREMSQELSSTNKELVSTVDRLRSTQAQLVQSEKLSAIGLLVAGVAHELNNPLTSIIGYAQLVTEELEGRADLLGTNDSLPEDVARILTESERAAKIVRNLLTFARRQTSERLKQDIADLCARVVELRAYDFRLKGVEVVAQFADHLPPVFADGGQIQQVLLNLLLNAEQAMRQSETRRLDLVVSYDPDSGAVLTEVRDTGHGIDTTNLRRIFDPFFTTRGVGEGTGLGLSIAYGIVRDHGGQIWAESHREKRTSFFTLLPARIDVDLASTVGTVLVGHGDPVVREFLAAVFMGWGFSVRPAANLKDAFESLSEDEVGLAVIDRSVVEPDPARWRTAWGARKRPTVMIAIGPASAERDTMQFFKDEARVVLAPPYDLYQVRRALAAATGAPL
jgi:two-component system NtrC family sensor kinase